MNPLLHDANCFGSLVCLLVRCSFVNASSHAVTAIQGYVMNVSEAKTVSDRSQQVLDVIFEDGSQH